MEETNNMTMPLIGDKAPLFTAKAGLNRSLFTRRMASYN